MRMVAPSGRAATERVVKAGLGYKAAVLAALLPAATRGTQERVGDLAERARANLAAKGVGNATVVVADGTLGWPERGTLRRGRGGGGRPAGDGALAEQLAVGGRPGRRRVVVPAHFVRLVGVHGLPRGAG
jgi:protein-L-isoaspartate(D-aspartate) O-methyltransferase